MGETVGPEARIRVDVDEAWDLEKASVMLAELEPWGSSWPSSLCRRWRHGGVAASTSIPLAADESVASLPRRSGPRHWSLRVHRDEALQGRRPAEALAIADVLPPTSPARSTARSGSPPRPRSPSACEATRAGRRLAHGLATQRLFAETIASVECELRDGDVCTSPRGPAWASR